jgi:hypothetical protein
MSINLTQKLIAFDGTPFTQEDGTPLTLKAVAILACSTAMSQDAALDPMAKYAIGEAGYLVARDMDLAEDQIKTLKDRIKAAIISPALVFAAVSAMEGINPVESVPAPQESAPSPTPVSDVDATPAPSEPPQDAIPQA